MNQESRLSRGQSVIEVLVALSVLALVFSGVALVIFGNKSVLTDKKLAAEAEGYAAEGIEAIKSIAKRDWTILTVGDHGVAWNAATSEWELSGTATDRGGFTRTVSITSEQNDEIKTITSKVTWSQADSPRKFESVLTVRLTWWEEVVGAGGDTGGTGTVPDWTNACTLGTVDLGTAVQGTDIDVLNKIAYITSIHAQADKTDFSVVDAADGNNPQIISQINTGPGLNAVDVAGNYAYVVQNKNTEQFQIIDVSDAGSPTTTAKYQLPGVDDSVGLSVFYHSEKVYVGTDVESGGSEFHILDVANKNNPSPLGEKEVGANVNAIHVRTGKAYLATSNDSKELIVLDVSDPANITEIGSFNATGTNDGLSVFVVGSNLYFGRAGNGNSSNHEFLILDISDLGNIKLLGSKELGVNVNDIRVRDTFAFLGTSDSNKEFQVLNIDGPANITERVSFNFPQEARGVDYESNFIYVSVRSNDTLRIITSECN